MPSLKNSPKPPEAPLLGGQSRRWLRLPPEEGPLTGQAQFSSPADRGPFVPLRKGFSLSCMAEKSRFSFTPRPFIFFLFPPPFRSAEGMPAEGWEKSVLEQYSRANDRGWRIIRKGIARRKTVRHPSLLCRCPGRNRHLQGKVSPHSSLLSSLRPSPPRPVGDQEQKTGAGS